MGVFVVLSFCFLVSAVTIYGIVQLLLLFTVVGTRLLARHDDWGLVYYLFFAVLVFAGVMTAITTD